MSDELLLTQLATEREHALRAVDGLTEAEMNAPLVPSGWTIARLLNHLAFDGEMFWISARRAPTCRPTASQTWNTLPKNSTHDRVKPLGWDTPAERFRDLLIST